MRPWSRNAQWALAAAGILLLVVLPYFMASTRAAYVVRLGGIAGLYVLLALGLNLVIGFIGLLDLGFMAFYAIGAYTAALLAIHHVPFFLCTIAAVGLAVLMRMAIGYPALRLRGDYLAIVTLGFGEVVRLVATNWDRLTNGPKGLPRGGDNIPVASLLGWKLSDNLDFYYLILGCVVGGIWICQRLNRSRIGRAWVAIREDEIAAELTGVNVTREKMVAFGLSAAFAGLAGAIFAHWERFVTPESFTFWESALLVCAVVLGGMGSVPGAIVGALCIVMIPEILRDALGNAFADARYLIFGAALVMMAILRPQGLWPSRRRSLELHPADLDEGQDVNR